MQIRFEVYMKNNKKRKLKKYYDFFKDIFNQIYCTNLKEIIQALFAKSQYQNGYIYFIFELFDQVYLYMVPYFIIKKLISYFNISKNPKYIFVKSVDKINL